MIELYNTLSRSKEPFKEIEKGKVKIYSCGPTVYDTQHIGNMRSAVVWDTLKRMFRYFSYEVDDVTNITDVGHLTGDNLGDASIGEDRMLKAAMREKLDPFQIARKYEEKYVEDIKKLNVILSKTLPRATEHISEQIEMIKKLEEGGYIYKTDDGVYFDVSKFKDYGKLSGQSLEEKKAGARVDENSQKRNQQDFALWKFAVGEHENHAMQWESPWGVGFPGWHIECSAMGHKYLGSKLDIHTGGIEHIPIHHENEIAQNICSNTITQVNYWLHNAHLVVDNEKMSKSIGNVYTLKDLEEKGYNPLAFREMCLRTHYRKQMNFTFESLDAGEKNLKRINDFYNQLDMKTASKLSTSVLHNTYNEMLEKFEKAIADDANTPVALSALYEFMNEFNKHKELSESDIKLAKEFVQKTDSVFGLLTDEDEIPLEVIELARERAEARANKDFAKSDELRDEIRELGYEVKDKADTKEGFILTKL